MAFTKEQVLEAMRKVVAERGEDYVYESPDGGDCVYQDPETGAPSCIVGCVVNELVGVDALERLGRIEQENGAFAIRDAPTDIIRLFDERAYLALATAQGYQDNKHPWGTALERAEQGEPPGGQPRESASWLLAQREESE